MWEIGSCLAVSLIICASTVSNMPFLHVSNVPFLHADSVLPTQHSKAYVKFSAVATILLTVFLHDSHFSCPRPCIKTKTFNSPNSAQREDFNQSKICIILRWAVRFQMAFVILTSLRVCCNTYCQQAQAKRWYICNEREKLPQSLKYSFENNISLNYPEKQTNKINNNNNNKLTQRLWSKRQRLLIEVNLLYLQFLICNLGDTWTNVGNILEKS